MKKMYNKKPTVVDENTAITENTDNEKRIKYLEEQVRQLGEQVTRMASALALNSRQIRRQNTDIHNVTTAFRNK
jgi:recombinational DNA repair protein RecR